MEERPGRQSKWKGAGSRNRATLALETFLDGQVTAVTQKAINLALAGDMAALRLCLINPPPRKDSPVAFDLPEIKINDAVPAMGALVKALGRATD